MRARGFGLGLVLTVASFCGCSTTDESTNHSLLPQKWHNAFDRANTNGDELARQSHDTFGTRSESQIHSGHK